MAGPSGADPALRHYSHDAWNSISATIKLPDKGAALGRPRPGPDPERTRRAPLACWSRSRSCGRPPPTGSPPTASGPPTWAPASAPRPASRLRARQRADAAKTHGLDDKLARGNALTRPYAVATVTVPKTARITEYGRKLDAAIRRAGYAPLRLDLAQDAAFAASTIPLGVSLTRKSDA